MIDKQMLYMDPMVDKAVSGAGFRLGNLIFMMGKHIVDSAAVDVDGVAEKLHRHRGTLDMPAGAPGAKGTIPKYFPIPLRIKRLPQYKIGKVIFLIFVSYVIARRVEFELIEFKMGKASVFRKMADRKIDAPILAFVCNPLLHQPFDQADHL